MKKESWENAVCSLLAYILYSIRFTLNLILGYTGAISDQSLCVDGMSLTTCTFCRWIWKPSSGSDVSVIIITSYRTDRRKTHGDDNYIIIFRLKFEILRFDFVEWRWPTMVESPFSIIFLSDFSKPESNGLILMRIVLDSANFFSNNRTNQPMGRKKYSINWK